MGTKLSPVGSSQSGGGSIGPTTPTDFTEGSVIFAGAGGVLAQDNAAFSFNPTTNTLSVTKIAALNNGYGFANAGITFTNGTQVSSNADGTLFFGNSYTNAAFLLSITNQNVAFGAPYQLGWVSTNDAAGAGIDIGIARSGSGILKVTDGSTGAGALHFQEQTAPSAPSANNVYLYAQDNGAGKTQLMAKFATGAAQQIAIEP